MKLSRDKIQRMVGSQGTMGGFGGVAGITEQRVHELLQDYVTNDDLTETLEPYATKDWVGSNYLSLSFFNALFQARKADGTTIVSPNNGDTSEIDSIKAMFGFWTDQYISALGQGDDGSAGVGDVTWALLADSSDTRPIALSHLTTALSTYATQSWVQSQGYATTAAVNALEFLNNVTGGNGLVTLSTNKSNSFVVDLTHQHSWYEIQDRPTTLAGFGITDASISNGVITIGTNTITPVTQVALTMPTGFSVSGSPVTKTGTFAITFATGYEGFTTALKQKIEALYSWFEVDNDGNIKTKDYTENDETKHRGFYSPSFISALGQGDDGTAGVGDVTWALLADDTDTRPIALSHLTTALSTYATQTWVQSQGYATTAAVNALEFLNNVTGGNGLVTLSTNKSNSFVVDLTHQHSWYEIQDRPDTFATYGLSAELSTILGNLKSMIIQGDGNAIGTYTPTSALTVNFVSGTNISISRDATNHTLTIANTYAHPTGGANTTISNANGRVLSSITVNSLGHVTSVGYKTLAMADMPAAMMYYNSISSSNGALTFSGYNISDTVVDLTHQHSWFEIQDRPTTLAGFGVSADDPLLKNNYLTISFFTSLFKAYAGSTEITPNNSTSTVDSIKAMFGFWTSQYISALGQGSDGTSGTGDVTWALLASDDTRPINISHLTGALSGYATQTWVTGTALSGYATQTWVQNQSYATTSTVNALEFLNNVTGGNGSFKLTTNKSNNFVVDLTHQHSWFDIQDRPTTITGLGVTLSASDIPDLSWSKITSGKPTTIAGYGITDAKIQNGVITLGTNTITPITSISRPTSGSWFNGTPQIGSDGVMEIGRYIDFHPTTSSTLDYSARIDCGTSTTARTFTLPNTGGTIAITSDIPTVNNSTITIKQTGINDQTFTLNGGNATITLVDTNTWRGMQNNLTTSTSTTSDSLSAYQGYLLANGYARDSTKLPLAGGETMTGHFSLYGSQYDYTTNSSSYGLDCNNSDIIGINGLFTNDYSESWTEGINFARSSSGWDSIYAQDGTWYFKANNGTAYATVYCGALYSTGAVTALSDARRKKIASRVNLNIEQVAQMPDIRFTWNDRDDDRMHVGTIAQEWQRILPEVVTDANDTEHTLSMDYGVAALIASICVARKVVDHERRIKKLEQENLELRNELNRLKIA